MSDAVWAGYATLSLILVGLLVGTYLILGAFMPATAATGNASGNTR